MTRLGTATVLRGDARSLPLADASVDAIVCDPPYGLEFMGKDWDAPWTDAGVNADAGFSLVGMTDARRLPRPSFTGSTNPSCRNCRGTRRGRRDGTAIVPTCVCDRPEFPNVRAVEMRAFQDWCGQWAAEALRVLKPGGWLLTFGGARTWHRMVCAVEDAGFEIRDTIAWLHGQGFPKSRDVSKDIDAAAGATRDVIGVGRAGASSLERVRRVEMGHRPNLTDVTPEAYPITAPMTDDARRWSGWGTALKPGFEPVCVARKPLVGTVTANVLARGTGALNIGGCRLDGRERTNYGLAAATRTHGATYGAPTPSADFDASQGRWPTNMILSHAGNEQVGDLCADGCVPGCPVADLDAQSGRTTSTGGSGERSGCLGYHGDGSGYVGRSAGGFGDSGGASRFFPAFRYEAKAPTDERPVIDGVAHPTVKPLELMRWLCRLVTQPGGRVLDMFAGSGTTVEAAMLEGFRVVAVELGAEYLPLIQYRIDRARRRTQPGISRLGKVRPPSTDTDQLDLFSLGGAA